MRNLPGGSLHRRRAVASSPFLALALLFALPEPGAGQWTRRGLEGRLVTALVVDPTDRDVVYAGTQFDGLFKSTDGGGVWVAVNNGYTADIAAALAADPSNAAVLYVGSNTGVFKSTDGGAHWGPASAGLPGRPVHALLLDPAVPDVLYVSVEADGAGGGVFRSGDGGASWSPRPLPVPSSTAAAFAVRGTELFAAWTNVLWRSGDAGATWSIPFPDVLRSSITAIAPLAGSVDVLVGLAQLGIAHGTAPPPGWTLTSAGLSSRRISALAVRPQHGETLFAAGNGGGVFRSDDAGGSWTPVIAGLANTDVATLAFDAAGTRLYAATADGVFSLDVSGDSCGGGSGLCLASRRFRVEVAWSAEAQGTSGIGHPVPLTDDTGSFWFFSPANLELMVKVLDARSINGRFWVFYGALSNVAYTITVTDTVGGRVKTYTNPQDRLASVADTDAF